MTKAATDSALEAISNLAIKSDYHHITVTFHAVDEPDGIAGCVVVPAVAIEIAGSHGLTEIVDNNAASEAKSNHTMLSKAYRDRLIHDLDDT